MMSIRHNSGCRRAEVPVLGTPGGKGPWGTCFPSDYVTYLVDYKSAAMEDPPVKMECLDLTLVNVRVLGHAAREMKPY